jgi:hypothetical protein
MEKKKKLTYLLGIVVIGVWGTILYRVYSSYFSKPKQEKTTEVSSNTLLTLSPVDTFSIAANYRDPFLGKITSTRKRRTSSGHASKSSATKSTVKVKSTPPATKWPKLKYGGMIKNQHSGKLVALFSIDAQSYRMKEGEMNKEILLKEIHRDSVVVEFAEVVKTIYK